MLKRSWPSLAKHRQDVADIRGKFCTAPPNFVKQGLFLSTNAKLFVASTWVVEVCGQRAKQFESLQYTLAIRRSDVCESPARLLRTR